MKITAGLTAALVGCAAAAQQAANVYQIPHDDASTSTATSLSPSLARLLLLQRLAPSYLGPTLRDFPDGVDATEVVSLMAKFGKTIPPMFAGEQTGQPSQLVLMLEDMTAKQIKDMGKAMKMQPSYTISNSPSTSAHDSLVNFDFYNVGVTNEHKCTVDQVSNPLEKKCWSGKSAVAKYNIKQSPGVIKSVLAAVSRLQKLSQSDEMETVIVLLPETTETSNTYWSDKPQELRRRQQTEQVIADPEKTDAPPAPTGSPQAPIMSCYESKESCMEATRKCSGHGDCLDRFSDNDDGDDEEGKVGRQEKNVCFTCKCLSTKSDSGSITHWAGHTCAKKDISVTFWLFAGFTLAIVGILSMSLSMLYSVGEEPLPGVIGAGVSRSK